MSNTYSNIQTDKPSGTKRNIWNTNPQLASILANEEDGYKYTQTSKQKVDWKCSSCNSVIKNKTINSVNSYGLSCNYCSDGFNYPEKFFANFLKQLNVEFEYQKTFEWSQNKIYDFYIEDLNIIIETHGRQHYDKGFERIGGRTVEEEQANDKLKYKLAMENGVDKYIVIDCRYSEMEYIKNSIMNSELTDLFDLSTISWNQCEHDALKSLVIEACELWNSDIGSTVKIGSILNISEETVRNYLKKGTKIGLCDYEVEKRRNVKVVQLTLDGEYINTFDSIIKASKEAGVGKTSIINACNGAFQHSKGFKWLYLEDYNDTDRRNEMLAIEKGNNRKLIQLTLDGEYVNTFNSAKEVQRELNIDKSAIGKVCKGSRKSAGGFRWKYVD